MHQPPHDTGDAENPLLQPPPTGAPAGLTEPELQALYRRRAGHWVDPVSTRAWCALCGQHVCSPPDGYDLCHHCDTDT